MGNTKRAFQLASSITSIVLSGILFISTIIILSSLSILEAQEDLRASVQTLKVVFIICLLFYIADLIVSIMLCAQPKTEDGLQKAKKLSITLLVLNGILFILEIIGNSVIGFVLLGIIVALLICFLCVKNNLTVSSAYNINVAATDNTVFQKTNTDVEYELLKYKKMLDNNLISQEEYEKKKNQILGL